MLQLITIVLYNSLYGLRRNFRQNKKPKPARIPPQTLLRAGETAFRTPPPFPQKKRRGAVRLFFKKVRAKDTISPQIETSRFERADSAVMGARRDNSPPPRRISSAGEFKKADLAVSFLKQYDKPKYFLYARKSTEDDDRQVMSIEAQLLNYENMRKENLEILENFKSRKSAKTPGREIFGEMMAKIEQGGDFGIPRGIPIG